MQWSDLLCEQGPYSEKEENIKPELYDDYNLLCSSPVPITPIKSYLEQVAWLTKTPLIYNMRQSWLNHLHNPHNLQATMLLLQKPPHPVTHEATTTKAIVLFLEGVAKIQNSEGYFKQYIS